AGKHDVVPIAEHENLRGAPNDALQLHHGPHAKPKLPQQQMLNEVERQAPRPERQLPVADRIKAKTAQLKDEQIGAEEIIAPILEEGRNATIVMLATTRIERPRRTNEQPPSGLERSPAAP